jgi:hypothetical protein
MTWFHTRWAFEESQHGLAFREYLTRSRLRSELQCAAFETNILANPQNDERASEIVAPSELPARMTTRGDAGADTSSSSEPSDIEKARAKVISAASEGWRRPLSIRDRYAPERLVQRVNSSSVQPFWLRNERRRAPNLPSKSSRGLPAASIAEELTVDMSAWQSSIQRAQVCSEANTVNSIHITLAESMVRKNSSNLPAAV